MSRALSPQDLRCARTGKTAYITRERAEKIVERSHTSATWRNEHGQPARRAYRCEHCHWWHLTHQEKRS